MTYGVPSAQNSHRFVSIHLHGRDPVRLCFIRASLSLQWCVQYEGIRAGEPNRLIGWCWNGGLKCCHGSAAQHDSFFHRQFRFTNPISPAFTTAGVQNCNHKLTEIPRTASEIRHRFQEQAMSTCLRCAWVVRTEYMMAVICDCETRIRQTDRQTWQVCNTICWQRAFMFDRTNTNYKHGSNT